MENIGVRAVPQPGSDAGGFSAISTRAMRSHTRVGCLDHRERLLQVVRSPRLERTPALHPRPEHCARADRYHL